jgi:hypothetical protein
MKAMDLGMEFEAKMYVFWGSGKGFRRMRARTPWRL